MIKLSAILFRDTTMINKYITKYKFSNGCPNELLSGKGRWGGEEEEKGREKRERGEGGIVWRGGGRGRGRGRGRGGKGAREEGEEEGRAGV